MDWLTFLSKIIDSLAWPVLVGYLFYLFRNDLPKIVKYVRKLKYKEWEMEFGESVRELEQETKHAIPEPPETISISGQEQEQLRERLYSIAEFAPRAAILEAWLQVEAAAVDAVKKKGILSFKSMPGPMRLRDYLIKSELLNKEQVNIFEKLRVLRNEAVHVAEAEFTENVVKDYISSALKLAAYLESKANEL